MIMPILVLRLYFYSGVEIRTKVIYLIKGEQQTVVILPRLMKT